MAKKNNDFVDSILEAQQNMVDTLVENSKKMANGNPFLKEMMDKGTQTYNDWAEKQKETVKEAKEKMSSIQENAKEGTEKVKDFYQNWFDTQMNWTKKAWEFNQDFMNKMGDNAQSRMEFKNPMDWFNNMNNFWSNVYNQNKQQQQWANLMQQFNPSKMNEGWKSATETWQNFYKQYAEVMQNSFAQLQQNMQTSTTQDAYNNMINVASSYGKFYQMWAPFWKSIQDKTFNAEEFKKTFNAEAYKDLMDQFFGLMPEGSKEYMEQMQGWWTEGMKQAYGMQKGAFGDAWNTMKSQNPFFNPENMFASMLGNYQDSTSWFKNAVSPIARMITPNQYTKNAQEWSEIMDKTAIYQIKNTELQYLMYTQGAEVMEELLNSIMDKIENGKEIKSIVDLHQEWLNISDKAYVKLFESDEYSKLMAEVSAMQLKLKKEIELQMEKAMVGFPVATRSELDELYKIIYDLKKEVRQLEKMLDLDENPVKKETITKKKSATK